MAHLSLGFSFEPTPEDWSAEEAVIRHLLVSRGELFVITLGNSSNLFPLSTLLKPE